MKTKWWSWVIIGALAVALASCDEEAAPEPELQPTLENTVARLVSDGWDPHFSSDSRKIVFVEAFHLAVYDTINRQTTVITPDYGSLEFCPQAPVWLTGNVVAFVRKDESSLTYKIWTVPAAGGAVTEYDVDVDEESKLAGDATGAYVYFTDGSDKLLYRLTLSNGGLVRLTGQHIIGFGHFYPAPKPGADMIYFVERELPFNSQPHSEYINEVRSTGGGIPVPVLNTDKPFLSGLTVSPNGKYLVYAHRDGLWSMEIGPGTETWLTRAPDTWSDKDRDPCFSPDGLRITFSRNEGVYICDAP